MTESRITQTHHLFSMTCGVEVNIRADAGTIWGLLIDARAFPRWNSTISGIEGQIREDERLRLHVPGTERTFTPRVSGVVANQTHDLDRRLCPFLQGRADTRVASARGQT